MNCIGPRAIVAPAFLAIRFLGFAFFAGTKAGPSASGAGKVFDIDGSPNSRTVIEQAGVCHFLYQSLSLRRTSRGTCCVALFEIAQMRIDALQCVARTRRRGGRDVCTVAQAQQNGRTTLHHPLNRVPDFKPGDTVRLLRASPAHLMTVRAAAPHTVLCASVGPDGKVQYEPYPPEDLELVTPADRRPR